MHAGSVATALAEDGHLSLLETLLEDGSNSTAEVLVATMRCVEEATESTAMARQILDSRRTF